MQQPKVNTLAKKNSQVPYNVKQNEFIKKSESPRPELKISTDITRTSSFPDSSTSFPARIEAQFSIASNGTLSGGQQLPDGNAGDAIVDMGYITFFPRNDATEEAGAVPTSAPPAETSNERTPVRDRQQDMRTQPTPPPDNKMVWQPNMNLLKNSQQRNSTLEGKIHNNGANNFSSNNCNSLGGSDNKSNNGEVKDIEPTTTSQKNFKISERKPLWYIEGGETPSQEQLKQKASSILKDRVKSNVSVSDNGQDIVLGQYTPTNISPICSQNALSVNSGNKSGDASPVSISRVNKGLKVDTNLNSTSHKGETPSATTLQHGVNEAAEQIRVKQQSMIAESKIMFRKPDQVEQAANSIMQKKGQVRVTNFQKDKPSTSDFQSKQPASGQKLRLTRRFQRNGTSEQNTMRSSRYHAIQQQQNNAQILANQEQHQQQSNVADNQTPNPTKKALKGEHRTLDTHSDIDAGNRQKDLVMKVFSPRSQKRHSNKPEGTSVQLSLNSKQGTRISSQLQPGQNVGPMPGQGGVQDVGVSSDPNLNKNYYEDNSQENLPQIIHQKEDNSYQGRRYEQNQTNNGSTSVNNSPTRTKQANRYHFQKPASGYSNQIGLKSDDGTTMASAIDPSIYSQNMKSNFSQYEECNTPQGSNKNSLNIQNIGGSSRTVDNRFKAAEQTKNKTPQVVQQQQKQPKRKVQGPNGITLSDNSLKTVDISSTSNGTPNQARRNGDSKISNPQSLNSVQNGNSNLSFIGSPQMRMRHHQPIQQPPAQIDFSDLQLKNFNNQYNVLVKETTTENGPSRGGQQQQINHFESPHNRQKLFSSEGVNNQGHMAHQMYVGGGFNDVNSNPYFNELDSSFAMHTPQQVARVQQPSMVFSEGNWNRQRTEKNNSSLLGNQEQGLHGQQQSEPPQQMATLEQNHRANKIIQKYQAAEKSYSNNQNTFSPRQQALTSPPHDLKNGNVNLESLLHTTVKTPNQPHLNGRLMQQNQIYTGQQPLTLLSSFEQSFHTIGSHVKTPAPGDFSSTPGRSGLMSPRGLASGASGQGSSGLGLESRGSDIQRRVIEDLMMRKSSNDRRSGSINPRRPVPIVKQQYKKANSGVEYQLSPKLPECFLRHQGGTTAVASQRGAAQTLQIASRENNARQYVVSQGPDGPQNHDVMNFVDNGHAPDRARRENSTTGV